MSVNVSVKVTVSLSISSRKAVREMSKEREGYVFEDKDGIWARVTYTDASGQRRNVKRKAQTKSAAKRILKDLLAELDTRGERGLDGQRMTFRQLAEKYREHKLFPAEYHGGRKVAGLRSWRAPQGYLVTLVENFGNQRIRDITHADIAAFKRKRLNTPVNRPVKQTNGQSQTTAQPRTLAGVNRELATLRAALNFAQRNKWLESSPFAEGDPLLSLADEAKRERILSFPEERRLLAECTGRRAHLRPLVIAAVDTGMRRGELLKLRWHDVTLGTARITVTALNTKTATARTVPLTPRLHAELSRLWGQSPQDLDGLVFGLSDNFKRAWESACTASGIAGLHFHDLRHTALTRFIQAGVPPLEVMKISGHTQMQTLARYINPAGDSLRRAADALATFHAAQTDMPDTASEMVN